MKRLIIAMIALYALAVLAFASTPLLPKSQYKVNTTSCNYIDINKCQNIDKEVEYTILYISITLHLTV